MKVFNKKSISELEKLQRTNLINTLSGYKSVNLIGSISESGTSNLAIFNSVFHLGADPALQGMIVRPDSVERHTLQNIRSTGYFTINQVHEDIREKAHQCAARFPREFSEFDAVGLKEQYLERFTAPFVEESKIKSGFKVAEILDLRHNGTHLVIGELEFLFVEEGIIDPEFRIDHQKANSLAVIGLDYYLTAEPGTCLPYAKPQSDFLSSKR